MSEYRAAEMRETWHTNDIMNEESYTPGPWLVDRSYDRRVGTTIRGGIMRPGAAHLPAIAKMIDTGIDTANLIGAAPELLAACKAAEACFKHWELSPSEQDAVNLLRTAIAKARGE